MLRNKTLILFLVSLVFIPKLYNISNIYLWFDEIDLYLDVHGISEHAQQAPLNKWLTKIWLFIFQSSDYFYFRLLSLTCWFLAIIPMLKLARGLGGKTIEIIVVLFWIFSPYFFLFVPLGRPYGLLILVSSIYLYCIYNYSINIQKNSWPIYLVAFIGAISHLLFLHLIAATIALLLLKFIETKNKLYIRQITLLTFITVLGISWTFQRNDILSVLESTPSEGYIKFLKNSLFAIIHNPITKIYSGFETLIGIFFLYILAFKLPFLKIPNKDFLFFLITSLLVGIISVTLSMGEKSNFGPMQWRYLAHLYPAYIILIALLISDLVSSKKYWLTSIIAVFLIFNSIKGLKEWYAYINNDNPAYKYPIYISAKTLSKIPDDAKIVFNSNITRYGDVTYRYLYLHQDLIQKFLGDFYVYKNKETLVVSFETSELNEIKLPKINNQINHQLNNFYLLTNKNTSSLELDKHRCAAIEQPYLFFCDSHKLSVN